MDFCQFTPGDDLTLGDPACGKDVYSVRGFWGISVWILGSQSLLLIERNLGVPLQLDHRLSWIEMILSLNNETSPFPPPKSPYILACYAHFLGAEGGEVSPDWKHFLWWTTLRRKQPGGAHENIALHWNTALKNSSAQLLLENLIHSLDVFLWLSISSHLAGSLTQPSPQDPSAFVKWGHKNLSNPSTLSILSHFRIAWCHTAGQWQTARLRADVLSSLHIWKLLFFVPSWDRYSSLPRPMGWEEWDENAICQHQQDWQVKPMEKCEEWWQQSRQVGQKPMNVLRSGCFPAAASLHAGKKIVWITCIFLRQLKSALMFAGDLSTYLLLPVIQIILPLTRAHAYF